MKNLGGPRRSCERDVSKDGIQLFGHTRETRTQSDAGTVPLMRNARQAGGAVLATGTPAVCVWGVVSSVVLRDGKAHHTGKDSTERYAGEDTHPGHVGPEQYEPTSLRALANRVVPCMELECNRGTGCGKTARPGLYGGRRVTGVPTVAAPQVKNRKTGGQSRISLRTACRSVRLSRGRLSNPRDGRSPS